MSKDLSVVNSDFAMKIGNMVYAIDHFSPESDMWVVDNAELGDMQMTPDGQVVKFSKQSVVTAHLTLNGGSHLAQVLFEVARQSTRQGDRKAKIYDISVTTIDHDGSVKVFTDGILTNAPQNISYGVDKKKDITFDFKFAMSDGVGDTAVIM